MRTSVSPTLPSDAGSASHQREADAMMLVQNESACNPSGPAQKNGRSAQLSPRCADCRRTLGDDGVVALWPGSDGLTTCNRCEARRLAVANELPENWR